MALNRLTDMGWYILNQFPHQNEILTCSHVATHKQHKGRGKVTRLNWKQKQQQQKNYWTRGGGKAAVYFVSLNSKQTTKKKIRNFLECIENMSARSCFGHTGALTMATEDERLGYLHYLNLASPTPLPQPHAKQQAQTAVWRGDKHP